MGIGESGLDAKDRRKRWEPEAVVDPDLKFTMDAEVFSFKY